MLYENICGININLNKAGIVVAIVDIISNVLDILIDFKFYSEFGSLQLAILSVISMTVFSNILLIHGTLVLNRWLMIYWMVFTALRILLGLLMFGMIFSIAVAVDEIFLYSYELIELVFLTIGFILVWKLFFKIRERTQNNFNLLSESVA